MYTYVPCIRTYVYIFKLYKYYLNNTYIVNYLMEVGIR